MNKGTTGMTLRLERVAARLTVNEVAAALGCSRNTITKYETRDIVRPEVVARYRLAIIELTEGKAA